MMYRFRAGVSEVGTAAQLPLNRVAVGEGGFEAIKRIRHSTATPAGSTTKMGCAGSGGQLAQAAGFDGMCCTLALLRLPERRCTLEAEI